jgi:hypothetical protein
MVALGCLVQIIGGTAVLSGLLALVFGLTSPSGGPPTCDDKVMHPGDQCRVVVDGDAKIVGYDGMVRRRANGLPDGLIIGGGGLGAGAVVLLSGRWLAGQWLFARGDS